MGFIHHWLVDEEGGHLKITKRWDGITLADIAATPGFAELKAQCDFLGVTVGLRLNVPGAVLEIRGPRNQRALLSVVSRLSKPERSGR